MGRTIQLSDDRYTRLTDAARARGFEIKLGAGSQLGEFIDWLLDCAPQPIGQKDEAWGRFLVNILPYVNELARALKEQGHGLKIEAVAQEGRCLLEQEE